MIEKAFKALEKAKAAGKTITVDPILGEGERYPLRRFSLNDGALELVYTAGGLTIDGLDGDVFSVTASKIRFETDGEPGAIHMR